MRRLQIIHRSNVKSAVIINRLCRQLGPCRLLRVPEELVAPVSKPAVSSIFKSASGDKPHDVRPFRSAGWEARDTPGLETCATIPSAGFVNGPGRHLWLFLLLMTWFGFPQLNHAQLPCLPPRITNQPMSLLVLAGDNAEFNIGVWTDTNCVYTYAWRFYGAYILGGVNPALTISNAQPTKVGQYSVVVTNVSGMVTSSVATLSVVSGPQPANASVKPGENVTFSVSVYGTGPASYQWLFNGAELPGATSRTLVLSNVEPCLAGGYSAMVTTPAGSVLTPEAILAVELPPPRLGGLVLNYDGAHFWVTGWPRVSYIVQASRDFAEWMVLSTNTAPASGTFEVIDPDASVLDGRFYRAVQP